MRKDQAEDFIFRVEPRRRQATVTLEAVDPKGQFLNRAEASLNVIDPKGKWACRTDPRGEQFFAFTIELE